MFWNAISRLIYFFLLGLIIYFISENYLPNLFVNVSDILGYVVLILIIYLLFELFIGLIDKPWELVAGSVLLIITLTTFVLGFWDKEYDEKLYNSSKIDPKFILLTSIVALGFTLWEYVNLLKERDTFKRITKGFILLFLTSYFITVGLLNTQGIKEHIGTTNTDYLAFVALSLTFITLGTKKYNQ